MSSIRSANEGAPVGTGDGETVKLLSEKTHSPVGETRSRCMGDILWHHIATTRLRGPGQCHGLPSPLHYPPCANFSGHQRETNFRDCARLFPLYPNNPPIFLAHWLRSLARVNIEEISWKIQRRSSPRNTDNGEQVLGGFLNTNCTSRGVELHEKTNS